MLMQSQRLERLHRGPAGGDPAEAGPGWSTPPRSTPSTWSARSLTASPARTRPGGGHGRPDYVAVYCRGDWMRVDQVLGNLLSNALRYAPPHEPVEIRLVPQGREVVFEVRDWGPGIPIDEQSRIFERFHRVGHYMTREPGGAARPVPSQAPGRGHGRPHLGVEPPRPRLGLLLLASPVEFSLNAVALGDRAVMIKPTAAGSVSSAAAVPPIGWHDGQGGVLGSDGVIIRLPGGTSITSTACSVATRSSRWWRSSATRSPISTTAPTRPPWPARLPRGDPDRPRGAARGPDHRRGRRRGGVWGHFDVRHVDVMHVASRVLAAGADFRLLGPSRPSWWRRCRWWRCAVRTGSGKSQTTRRWPRSCGPPGARWWLSATPCPTATWPARPCSGHQRRRPSSRPAPPSRAEEA